MKIKAIRWLVALLLLSGAAWSAPSANQKLTQPDPQAVVLHTHRGDIVFELYPNAAPHHVQRIKELVKKHYYDGLLFHRVIPNFMIQFGDPNTRKGPRNTWGAGGGDVPPLQAEFNALPHVPGTLSMARTSDPNSASTQFFICVGTPSYLNGQYTVFGHVIKGQDIADAISKVDKDGRDAPLKDERVEKAYLIKHP
ncbi:MAG TPA: peptidylprolyl isomerase [Candidatus Xenobia bacterium]|jgi:cyclophilin family peptidyl-prolyl cis-trans isomerase